MILVDAHVHIYDCFDLEKFLDAAYSNFQSEADRLGHGNKFTPILLLAETQQNCWFDRLREFADGRNIHKDRATQKWEFHHTSESVSLNARSGNSKCLIIVAGRQVETAEGLEVLALFTTGSFRPDIPIIDLIKEVKKHDALPVIPWGFGKWLGRRGLVLKRLLKAAKSSDFFLGENGGRPNITLRPSHFKIAEKRGVRILPGTDSLPIESEFLRVASFGFSLNESCSEDKPARDLKKMLLDLSTEFTPYGKLEGLYPFLRNQIAVRLRNI
jgi:hypothetical protein